MTTIRRIHVALAGIAFVMFVIAMNGIAHPSRQSADIVSDILSGSTDIVKNFGHWFWTASNDPGQRSDGLRPSGQKVTGKSANPTGGPTTEPSGHPAGGQTTGHGGNELSLPSFPSLPALPSFSQPGESNTGNSQPGGAQGGAPGNGNPLNSGGGNNAGMFGGGMLNGGMGGTQFGGGMNLQGGGIGGNGQDGGGCTGFGEKCSVNYILDCPGKAHVNLPKRCGANQDEVCYTCIQ